MYIFLLELYGVFSLHFFHTKSYFNLNFGLEYKYVKNFTFLLLKNNGKNKDIIN